MRHFPHLKRNHRSGNWVYFRRFPLSVRAAVGRTFFERSLRTSDRRALPEAWAEANREFEQAIERASSIPGIEADRRSAVRNWFDAPEIASLRPTQLDDRSAVLSLEIGLIKDAIERWGCKQRQERAHRIVNEPDYLACDKNFRYECQIVGACGETRNWLFHCPPLLKLTTDLLNDAGIAVPKMHSALYVVERLVEVEFQKVLEDENRWRHFDFATLPDLGKIPHTDNVGPASKPLMQAVEDYIKATRKPVKTASKLRLVAKYINSIFDCDVNVHDVTKDKLIELQMLALSIPARLTAAERAQPIALIAASQTKQSARSLMTPQAVASWFNLLGGFFNWAIRLDLAEKNPVSGVRPKVSRLDERGREPFSDADLRAIFEPQNYPAPDTSSKYWIPLIALFTGARLNEIGQLLVSDVYKADIPYIHITDRTDIPNVRKRLKNVSSRRKVPIHSTLIKLGFFTFVGQQSGPYLFPELPHNDIYEPTKSYSQWFGRYLRSVGIAERTKVFHSFRHTFKDACRKTGIEEEVHDALTGHGKSRSLGRAYGAGVPLERLSTEINRLRFDLE